MTTGGPGRDLEDADDDRPAPPPGRSDEGEYDDKDVSGDDPTARGGSGYTSKDPG